MQGSERGYGSGGVQAHGAFHIPFRVEKPVTYERQYVDKDSSGLRRDGYGTALDYGFDHHQNDPILKDLASIQDDELKGEIRPIVVVDFFDKGKQKAADEYVAGRGLLHSPGLFRDGTDAPAVFGSFAVKTEIVKRLCESFCRQENLHLPGRAVKRNLRCKEKGGMAYEPAFVAIPG